MIERTIAWLFNYRRLVDPRAAQTLLADWVHTWSAAHDISAGTWAKYQSHLRNHILPRYGGTPVGEINRMAIKAWVKTLRRGLAEPLWLMWSPCCR